MKIFIPFTCLVALTFAEPPVGDGYAAARSSHNHDHHHGTDHQRSLSQEYGVPFERAFGSGNSLATEYGPPSARSGISQEYGPPGLRNAPSQTYLPAARNSQEYAPASGSLSEEYGAPASRSLSQNYGVPDARNAPSVEYGAPNARSDGSQHYHASSLDSADSYPAARSPSSQYGVPELRLTPSETYGAPGQRSSNSAPFPTQKYGIPRGSSSRRSQFRSNTVSQGYGAPSSKSSEISQGYSAPRNSFKSSLALSRSSQHNVAQRTGPSQTYGAPASRTLSSSYGAPNARSSGSFFHGGKSVSQSYGSPSQKEQADSVEVVSARGLSQEHGTPSHSANLKTDAVASSYAGARHATHGASGHDMPAEQYGVPQQYSVHEDQSQGYEYPRARFDEQLNEEPAGYDFAYKVEDYESGSDFGHQETREDNRAEGSYFVVLPDGTKQTVEYEADERGFKPRISLERADASAGYDENAQDLTRSAGPY